MIKNMIPHIFQSIILQPLITLDLRHLYSAFNL